MKNLLPHFRLHKLCWSMNDNEVQRWTKSDDMTLVERFGE